jgi:hypothetical protein
MEKRNLFFHLFLKCHNCAVTFFINPNPYPIQTSVRFPKKATSGMVFICPYSLIHSLGGSIHHPAIGS